MNLKMTAAELQDFLSTAFPQVGDDFVIESVAPEGAVIRMLVSEKNLRPGNTISGPSMFTLADVAMYITVLSLVGPKALAVTTNCSIDFMRKPAAGVDLIGETRLLKLGRSLAVGDILIRSEGAPEVLARASMTYSLPPS